jgi:hypothetical protein
MNWHHDQSLQVEPWQIEDYRSLPLESLFARLKEHQISFNRTTFTEAAQDFDSPEDFTEYALNEREFDAQEQDQIYLVIFELWRRLLPEKQSFSIFCDELDHQIFLYDHGETQDLETIQDALSSLESILDENVDEGVKPADIFGAVCNACANDLESFLYDFIAEQIDLKNFSYASELIEGFAPYLQGKKWFDLLRARLLSHTDEEGCQEAVKSILKKALSDPDLEYNFELLDFLAQFGDPQAFVNIAKSIVNKMEYEDDFKDLLSVCADYFHFLDDESKENAVRAILQKRAQIGVEESFQAKDPDCKELLRILASR